MPMELTPLIERLSLSKTVHGDDGFEIHRGVLAEREVVGIVTGMGTEYATVGITRLLDAVAVDHVVVVGITGAVDDDTPIGTLVLPETVVLGSTGDEYQPTPLGHGTHQGKLLTGDVLITGNDMVAEHRESGVVALDMETAATAAVCEARGIPWSVFRAVSDQPADGAIIKESFGLSNLDGTPNHEAIEQFFKDHPERVEQLARLAEGASVAAKAAAEAAVRACSPS